MSWRTVQVPSIVVLLVFPSTLSIASFAADDPCSTTEAQGAESVADTFRSWDTLHESFKLYRQCDDSAIGEGYSESVARILVDHWKTLPRLAQLERRDPAFGRLSSST
jgi:hypothetical protein